MSHCLVGLGSNLGNRQQNLQSAVDRMGQIPDTTVARVSSWFDSAPIGGPAGQANFLNAAAVLETTLLPLDLLNELQEIEYGLRRTRDIRWGARTIDLDILLWEELQIQTSSLIVPHPRFVTRRFALEPAAQIAGEWIHPATGWTLERHLRHVTAHPNRFLLVADRHVANVWKTQVLQMIPPDVPATVTLADSTQTIAEMDVKLFVVAPHFGTVAGRCATRQVVTELIQTGRAPVLIIESDSMETIVEETVAAILAMR